MNKPKGLTSRDVVNIACKSLNTKKIGHTGTLDPIATGVLVLCIGNSTKLVEILTSKDKEYIATVKLGILTDTLDSDGITIERKNVSLKKEELIEVLNSFVGTYLQEVPKYSAVKVNGKKMYEYARKKVDIESPKRVVRINSIELLDFNNLSYKFKVEVSKGTYIRSLIKDINDKLGIIGVMDDLIRVRQGNFNLKNSCDIEHLKNGNFKLLTNDEVLKDYKHISVDDKVYNKIRNGQLLDNIYEEDERVFTFNSKVIAIYKKYEKEPLKIKPYKMLI